MKALIITYYFPPVGGGGVTRVLKFVKYLKEFGWDPVVLTATGNPCGYGTYDPTLVKEVPDDTEMYYAFSYDPISIFQTLTKNKISFDSEGNSYGNNVSNFKRSLVKKIIKPMYTLIDKLFLIPDARILWVPSAVVKARNIIKSDDIDIVYITGPPHSVHLIGFLLKKLIKIPVIIDFRDAWTSSPSLKPAYGLRRVIEKRMEQSVLDSADKIICTTKPIADGLQSVHPNVEMSKFKIITNGFDPADYESMTYEKNEKFTICHTGVLRNKKTPDYFIKAVAELVNEHPELKNKMQVFFVGNFPMDSQHLIKELFLDEVIYATGYLSHPECICYQLESNVLLLLLFEEEDGKSVYPGKMFEYIAARSPILAAVPEGLSADFIRSEEVGIVVHPRDIDKMKNVIYQFYLQHENRKLLLNDASFNRFDRKELTRQLTETFNEVMENE